MITMSYDSNRSIGITIPILVTEISSLVHFCSYCLGMLLQNKEITKTYQSGSHSVILCIPKNMARAYKIDTPSHVLIEATEKGILIKKLDLEEVAR